MSAEATDYLDMPDDEFEKLSEPSFEEPAEEPEGDTPVEPEEEDPAAEEEDAGEEDPEPSDTPKAPEESEVPLEEADDLKEGDTPEKGETQEKEENSGSDKVDFEVEYKKLMAPFKANGTEITPKSPEDAVRLMQMGANYHKKMAGMKPAMRALKTLQNNGLLDDGKLDYLIELHQGKPEAITKLLKDSKVDPLDMDLEAETTYTPANYSATDAEVELDSVLDSIQDSPSYNKTINVITKEWDKASRDQIRTDPKIISAINEHIGSGVYDTVKSAVDYERSMGRLTDVSYLEAYKAVGNKLEKEGAFAQPTGTPPSNPQAAVTPPVQKPDPEKERKRKAQKKAAGPTGSSSRVSKLPKDFNPLEMSDEEFAKFDPKLIGL